MIEYQVKHIHELNDDDLVVKLSKLASEGWELVTAVRRVRGMVWVFKKQIVVKVDMQGVDVTEIGGE